MNALLESARFFADQFGILHDRQRIGIWYVLDVRLGNTKAKQTYETWLE